MGNDEKTDTIAYIDKIIPKVENIAKSQCIVDKFGEKQIVVAIEEMAELTQALTKYMRIQGGGQPVRKDLQEVLENIKEELADVQLIIMQLQFLFWISGEELIEIMEAKVDRTLRAVGKDNA